MVKGYGDVPDKTNKELALEVQELRQFCIMLIMQLRNAGLSEDQCDHWWDKLGGYRKVENELDSADV